METAISIPDSVYFKKEIMVQVEVGMKLVLGINQ
jgi:hypothetical protein